MSGNIIGVIAQRLVRILCTNCKEPYEPHPEERMLLGDLAEQAPVLYRPIGCRHCDNKGYRGRTPIMELLVMDADMDELVARRSTMKELRTAAMTKGFKPLAEAGLARVLDGSTTLMEVSRAVDLTGRYV